MIILKLTVRTDGYYDKTVVVRIEQGCLTNFLEKQGCFPEETRYD